jgi:uncharacterized CHY-type Zn-finger protein
MHRVIHGTAVIGVDVDEATRCAHYHSERDIIAIKFKCCGKWFPCHLCHGELARHEMEVWPANERNGVAILCGGCGARLSVRDYLQCESACPACGREFNPACANHRYLYFGA